MFKSIFPQIKTCECCGKQFFLEEGRDYETLCIDCQDPWWREDD